MSGGAVQFKDSCQNKTLYANEINTRHVNLVAFLMLTSNV